MSTKRYTPIASYIWKRDDGMKASIYGACPWTSAAEEPRWKMVMTGWTVRDMKTGTVGIGKIPWDTKADAEAWIDEYESRMKEAA